MSTDAPSVVRQFGIPELAIDVPQDLVIELGLHPSVESTLECRFATCGTNVAP